MSDELLARLREAAGGLSTFRYFTPEAVQRGLEAALREAFRGTMNYGPGRLRAIEAFLQGARGDA